MKPEVIRFASRPHPFRVDVSRCANPDCECVEVNFRFVEVSRGRQRYQDGCRFDVLVNGETFEELNPPARPADIASAVQEFLRDYPAHEKAQLKEATRKKRETARRLREYRVDPQVLDDDRLVTWGEVASETGSVSTGGHLCVNEFEHEGDSYLVDDLYCPRAFCDCRKVHLLFLKQCEPERPEGPLVLKDHFLAEWEFGGQMTIGHCSGCAQPEGLTVANAWREEFGDAMEAFKWRYQKIKEIARRTSPASPAIRDVTPAAMHTIHRARSTAASSRPGRNDPCPCGSGKKYKKCCGR